MNKTLKVIKPCIGMEVGDVFEFNEENDSYTYRTSQKYNSSDENEDVSASFESIISISPSFAEKLVKDGILAKESNKKNSDTSFVNVFDEIDKLIESYENALRHIDEDYKHAPECLKIEKTTVLKNLIKVLTHLKNLKK